MSLRTFTSELPTRRASHGIVVLYFLAALGAWTVDLYLPALPALRADLRVSPAVAQLTLTATTVGFATGQLLVGPWSDAVGRRFPLVAAVGLHVMASFGVALAPEIYSVLVCRFLQGAGAAGSAVVAVAAIRDMYTGRRFVRALARLALITGAAPIVAPTLGSQLLRLVDWRGLFVCVAAYGLAALPLVAVFLPETLPPAHRHSGVRPADITARYARLLKDRTFTGTALIGGLVVSGVFAYLTSSPFLIQQVYGLDTQSYGLLFAAQAGCFLVGSQAGSRVILRFSPQRLLCVSLPLLALSGYAVAAAAALHTGLAGLVCPTMLFLFSAGLSVPCLPVLALGRHGHQAGTAAALLGAANFGFAGVMSPVVGAIGLSTAVPTGLVMGLTATAATGLLPLLLRRRER
ncbi:multidrug effflux MFS transporter [Streptomyces sp. NPDC004237]|uniref:multidrug effflux MFS transporter n=1 Tax=Streptomyces sp. NPDC004237 TaxID=3154455 RepID=UPI00339F51D4